MRLSVGLGLAAALVAVSAQASSPIEGLWRTPVRHGVVELYACGEALCGRVVSSDVLTASPNRKDTFNKDPTLRERPLKGLTMLSGFTGGPKEWKGGIAYNPDDGNSYHGSLTLVDPHTVKVTGCVVVPLCRSQIWKRAD